MKRGEPNAPTASAVFVANSPTTRRANSVRNRASGSFFVCLLPGSFLPRRAHLLVRLLHEVHRGGPV